MEFRNNYYFLSNMYPCNVTYKDMKFKSSESAFQAMKSVNPKQFCNLNGYDAKKLGKTVELREDWNEVKATIMLSVLKAKFSDKTLRSYLNSVTEPIIEDNQWGDTYWGRCNGIGLNRLGIMLEAIKANMTVKDYMKENTHHLYLLVVGSRNFHNFDLMESKLNKIIAKFNAMYASTTIHIVSGGANGADTLAEQFAKKYGYKMHVFKADWKQFGKSAGFIRNEEMHKFISDKEHRGCVAFWDGESKGTAQNFELAKTYNNPCTIIKYKDEVSRIHIPFNKGSLPY